MWGLLAQFLIFVVLLTLATYVAGRWISRYVQRHIAGRLEAIDRIVNEEAVPEAWLRSYRKRAAKLIAAGATDRQIASLSGIARKRCLANIQELIRYTGEYGLSDTSETKQFMVDELTRQQLRWQDDTEWHALVDLTQLASPVNRHTSEADERTP